MSKPYNVKQIFNKKSSIFDYDCDLNTRCLSPIRRSCRPSEIFVKQNRNIPSPRRLSRTPTKQWNNYRTDKTPQKNRNPLIFNKNPLVQRVEDGQSYRTIHQNDWFIHTSPNQNNFYRSPNSQKLFTNLMSKIGSTQNENQISFKSPNNFEHSCIPKYNCSQKLGEPNKKSFTALLQNIKAVDSINYQVKNKNQCKDQNSELKERSNFQLIKNESQKQIKFSKKIAYFEDIKNEEVESSTMKWSLCRNPQLKQSLNGFSDIQILLKKISQKPTIHEEAGCVNVSVDKNTKESFNMDAFL